ncbi:glycosyltransferase [Lysinibacillus fusiformis]|uniref:glycosyltransferase n=1 Tax=Lysinibacillus fusiformis TaxID=28031 RepID=UPI003AAD7EC5
MEIITSVDDKYAMHLGAMIVSMFENTKFPEKISINILNSNLSLENKGYFSKSIEKYGGKIKFIEIDSKRFEEFHERNYISRTAYYRIAIPELFPNEQKVIYLDCDIILEEDITELNNIDISDYYLAATCDENDYLSKEIGLDVGDYFNSGVLIINIEKWRESKLTEKIVKFIIDPLNKKNTCDQDALNHTVKGNYRNLGYEWNYIYDNHNRLIRNRDFKPKLIHFAGNKPWGIFSNHPYKSRYEEYIKLSLWKDDYEALMRDFFNKKIVIFGASLGGERLYKRLQRLNIDIFCFVDNDSSKWGKLFNGKVIISPTELGNMDNLVICIGSLTYKLEIIAQLKQLGFTLHPFQPDFFIKG